MTRTSLMLCIIGAACLVSANSFALEGAEYASFKVGERTYTAPIPNKETKQEWYFLKKALAGDTTARELALGGAPEKFYFIGDEGIVRWLVLTQDGERIIEYDAPKLEE